MASSSSSSLSLTAFRFVARFVRLLPLVVISSSEVAGVSVADVLALKMGVDAVDGVEESFSRAE